MFAGGPAHRQQDRVSQLSLTFMEDSGTHSHISNTVPSIIFGFLSITVKTWTRRREVLNMTVESAVFVDDGLVGWNVK